MVSRQPFSSHLEQLQGRAGQGAGPRQGGQLHGTRLVVLGRSPSETSAQVRRPARLLSPHTFIVDQALNATMDTPQICAHMLAQILHDMVVAYLE